MARSAAFGSALPARRAVAVSRSAVSRRTTFKSQALFNFATKTSDGFYGFEVKVG